MLEHQPTDASVSEACEILPQLSGDDEGTKYSLKRIVGSSQSALLLHQRAYSLFEVLIRGVHLFQITAQGTTFG